MLQESKVAPAGVLVDLGVQLTGAEEKNIGLSYFEAVPLDGRFDPSRGVSAKTWLQNVTQVWMKFGFGWKRCTLPKTNSKRPENRSSRKESSLSSIIFQRLLVCWFWVVYVKSSI